MIVLYFLVPLALLFAAGAALAFRWAARSGQFDDSVTPAWRVVLDDDPPPTGPPGPPPSHG